ncbi:hypothetical protein PENTCL1PPCAC_7609, partial [Pristionchus entomophagus]
TLIAFSVLVSGAEAVMCFHCSSVPTNVPCDDNHTCNGTSCYVAMKGTDFHAGCADDIILAEGSCLTEKPRRMCGCADEKCNFGSAMGSFKSSEFSPVQSKPLSNFFETITPIAENAPPPAAPSTEAPIVQPIVPIGSTVSEAPVENNSTEPAVDTSSTTTRKPNGGSTVPLALPLAAACFMGAALLF